MLNLKKYGWKWANLYPHKQPEQSKKLFIVYYYNSNLQQMDFDFFAGEFGTVWEAAEFMKNVRGLENFKAEDVDEVMPITGVQDYQGEKLYLINLLTN